LHDRSGSITLSGGVALRISTTLMIYSLAWAAMPYRSVVFESGIINVVEI
jgi:hypothetical protein